MVQPTPFCNLDCDYCYLADRANTVRMPPAVLRRTFEQVLASRHARGEFTVVWHSGEPLVVGIDFYEEAIALIEELDTRGLDVHHSFQTNATLVTPAWCDFFKRHRVRLGVSVDGPAFLHDAHRKTRAGGGTHARAMAGVRCLQDHGVSFHVISVLTSAALDHPDELFRFYVDHGIRRVGFNFEEVEGINASSSLGAEGADERARAFLRRFLELMETSGADLRVRELHGMGGLVARGGAIERNQENTAMRILSVDHAGNVSTWSPELLGQKSAEHGDFLLGNVMEDDLDALQDSPKFRRLRDEIDGGIAACRESCEYFGVCGGGSPSNKYFENGTFSSTETLHCRLSKQAVADVVLEHLESALAIA
ncbi:MAG: cyclophane-forming radical SAM/SPASM peptide maturase GrrM/OscB [Thermoanaerobaculia bacterium]